MVWVPYGLKSLKMLLVVLTELMNGTVEQIDRQASVDMLFIADAAPKILKKCNIFCL